MRLDKLVNDSKCYLILSIILEEYYIGAFKVRDTKGKVYLTMLFVLSEINRYAYIMDRLIR